MASPSIESLCCVTSFSHFSKIYFIDFHDTAYNIVSIVASLLGVAGGVYQVMNKQANASSLGRGDQELKNRNRVIIMWLAVADLMAALGILTRSMSWLIDKKLETSTQTNTTSHAFCIGSSAWIHYFYTVTYMWTFIYALDVKYALEGKQTNPKLYHFLAWIIPGLLCMGGLLFLYLPDLNCQNHLVNPYQRYLPNYLSTFLPILFVLIANPILYLASFSNVQKLLIKKQGRFTNYERHIIQSMKMKFLMINLVFYICWLPNILNGILLWSAWDSLPKYVLISIWFLMAVVNPLQAVLNCFVYRSWNKSIDQPVFSTNNSPVQSQNFSRKMSFSESSYRSLRNLFTKSPEKTPLLVLTRSK